MKIDVADRRAGVQLRWTAARLLFDEQTRALVGSLLPKRASGCEEDRRRADVQRSWTVPTRAEPTNLRHEAAPRR